MNDDDETEQMEFADVVDSERMIGDQTYTAWIAAGRPTLTGEWGVWQRSGTPEDKQPRIADRKEAL